MLLNLQTECIITAQTKYEPTMIAILNDMSPYTECLSDKIQDDLKHLNYNCRVTSIYNIELLIGSFKADAIIAVISEDYYILSYFLDKILQYLESSNVKKLLIVHAEDTSSQHQSDVTNVLGVDNVVVIDFSGGDDQYKSSFDQLVANI